MNISKCPSALHRGHFDSIFAFILYVGVLFGKTLIYVSGSPASPLWKWLLVISVAEACGWTCWILRRHGARLGPVLLLFPLACTLYSAVPICLLAAGLDIFSFSDASVRSGMFMQSLMATHLWAFWGVMFSKKHGERCLARINGWFDTLSVSLTGVWMFILAGLVIAIACLVNFFISGAAGMVGSASRIELMATSETGKLWLLNLGFVAWLMICAVLWNSKKARATIGVWHVVSAMLAITMFMYQYLLLGNRNEMASVLIFVSVLLCLRGRVSLVVAFAALCIPAMLYFGLTREGPSQSLAFAYSNSVTFYLNTLGEFVFPHYPLLDHISSRQDLWYGWSYVRFPATIFPTFGLWNKQVSLALQFSRAYGGVGGMGYAYTPLGEGYANFGVVSVIIVPLYLAICGRIFTSRRFEAPLFFLVFLSLSLNINRGEFGSIAQEVIILVTMLYGFLAILRARYLIKRLNIREEGS